MIEKKDLNILFMGTPEFASHILDHIIKVGYNVVGVVTAPDKPSGRGRKLHQSAVKKYAVKKGLKLLQPQNLKSNSFQEELQNLNPDLAVVVAFRMLPKKVWNYPKLGTFNLHASLLPDYRGAAPINWVLINGEKTTGVTTFFLDENIDTGKIIFQQKVTITPDENAEELHDQLMTTGAELVEKTLRAISTGKVTPQEQSPSHHLHKAPKLTPENTKIDWNQSGETIHNFVRGLAPYPSAWSYLQNGEQKLRCKIFKVKFTPAQHQTAPGILFTTKKTIKVAVPDGYIHLLEMQFPGKRKMPIKEIVNGLRLEKNANMR